MQLIAPDDAYVSAIGDFVLAGEHVDVPDDVGKGLIDQGWFTPGSNAGRAAAAARKRLQSTDPPEDEAVSPDTKED